MRDVGALLWVVIVIAGVISSIVSSARKQQALRAQAFRPPPQRPAAPSAASWLQGAAPRVVRARPAPAPAPPTRKPSPPTAASVPPGPAFESGGPAFAPSAAPAAHKQAIRARTLFGARSALVRAIVAAEVLGKPHALRDEA